MKTPLSLVALALPVGIGASPDLPGTIPSDARRDVQAVCPDIHEDLPDRLAPAWQRVGREAELRVLFTVDGDRVVAARALSGPRIYHRWVTSALRDLTCRNDRDTPQHFLLDVRFVFPS